MLILFVQPSDGYSQRTGNDTIDGPFWTVRTIKDTVCLPEAYLKKALKKIEQGKADSAELLLRKDEIKDLLALTDQQRVSIGTLHDRTEIQESRIVNLTEQRDLSIKQLKKEKAKAVFFKVAGIGITASLTFLLIFFK